jgi:histidinol dehydrogenase
MIAGPSEILVMADETANPKYVAADLMSQAEHDRLASAILVTTSEKLADDTIAELDRQMQELSRKEIIAESLANYGAIIICGNKDRACEIANRLAPEHLEVLFENPLEYVGRLDNAGSIFLGFFSPLSVNSFEKRSSFIYYTEDALAEAKDDIVLIAEKEGLTAHANAIKVRF